MISIFFIIFLSIDLAAGISVCKKNPKEPLRFIQQIWLILNHKGAGMGSQLLNQKGYGGGV